MTEANKTQQDLRTLAANIGIDRDPAHGAIMPPIYLSTNYTFAGFNEKRAFDYSRSGNPTRALLAEALAALEGGAGAVVTATGMAAVDLVLQPLPAGARVIAPHDCYGGTQRLLNARTQQGRIQVEYIHQGDPAALDAAFATPADLVLIETPSNPLMRITDIADVAARAHAAGAKVVADNTFLSPALQRPLTLGADQVIHSTTKYLNGHSDVVGGVVVSKTPEDAQLMAWWANCVGTTGAAFDAYLTLRGLRTLFPRLDQQQATAQALANHLARHPAVSAVHYPGLDSHPGHALAARQQAGFGAMMSFELKGGVEAVKAFVANLRLFSLAESLGGIESLIAHPATMTHAAMSPEAQAIAGITPGLLRVSVGLEGRDDLLSALDVALSGLPA